MNHRDMVARNRQQSRFTIGNNQRIDKVTVTGVVEVSFASVWVGVNWTVLAITLIDVRGPSSAAASSKSMPVSR